MKKSEVKKISKEELPAQLAENRERLRVLRFDLVAGKVKNVRDVRRIRKDIARMMTILGEKK